MAKGEVEEEEEVNFLWCSVYIHNTIKYNM